MTLREEIEAAMEELDALLENDPLEGEFQKWFEKHPVAMRAFNYREAIPQPKLTRPGALELRPDFMCQRVDGLWEIVEIKRASTAMLRDSVRRKTFYADAEQYVAQCHEYAEHFDDEASRAAFEQRYGRSVQKKPSSTLIAGRNDGLDRVLVHGLLSRRTPPVQLCTYDDLRNLLDFQRLQLLGGKEFTGLSISLVLAIDPSPDGSSGVLCDIGTDPNKNRITLREISGQGLALEVKDARGLPHAASIPFDDQTFLPREYFHLSLQLGSEPQRGLLLVEVHGRCCTEYRLPNLPFDLDPLAIVLGCDLNGEAFSYARFAFNQVGTGTLSFELRAKTRSLIFSYYKELFRTGRGRQAIQFKGRHSLFTNGHPRFTKPSAPRGSQSNGFVQPDPERQPFVLEDGADLDQ